MGRRERTGPRPRAGERTLNVLETGDVPFVDTHAVLHGGDLRLVRSDDDWTEFELRLRIAEPAPRRGAEVA